MTVPALLLGPRTRGPKRGRCTSSLNSPERTVLPSRAAEMHGPLYRQSLALSVTDPAQARNTWAKLDQMLVNDAAIVPVWTSTTNAIVATRVGNWFSSSALSIPLSQIWVTN